MESTGNTALHLAVMTGHKECLHLLLAHGAPVKARNLQGWTALAEAVSYGDRLIISHLLKKLKIQSRESMNERRPMLVEALKKLRDFSMIIRWDFQSWVPLLSRVLPSDVCHIYKKGSSIRVDTTLIEFSDLKWQRGNISIIYDGDLLAENSFLVLDNENMAYQRMKYEGTDSEIEEEVDLLMSSDIMTATLPTTGIEFSRAQTGWIFREDRRETVGASRPNSTKYLAREHLSEEDIAKNKAVLESISKGTMLEESLNETIQKKSLAPPEKTSVTWEEYINAEPGKATNLSKETKKVYKAVVGMCEDFPMEIEDLLTILELFAPVRHISKLRDFIELKLPPGFPVKLDIPLFPTISAKVTFEDFQYHENISVALFQIPPGYQKNTKGSAGKNNNNRVFFPLSLFHLYLSLFFLLHGTV
ncbi:Ankyrin repeat domain-containing protein 13C-A [Apostichopus japonicus]|uniref:Ankyrin repeat domain-containing protein 13C-A n=1 Tax=Stichopus japonicus TaxID=307972 RepID=A0A2G8KF46_STIJA|nr:Ankyrin repeat domain-containing protein 13C-A [Apostichopus japonicus]